MYRFLSKFKLTSRIYAGYVILGAFAVLLSFAAMFAVGSVHGEYARANNVIESVRRLSALETTLFSLNRSLFFFSAKGGENERQEAQDAFSDFETRVAEIEPYLENPDIREKYNQAILASVNKYRSDMEELFSLKDKSVEANEKLRRFAEQASEKLNTMIEEATLPSATFALNNLQEQLDAVLRSADSSSSGEEYEKRLTADLTALKKAASSAKQAEMVNAKQLKIVLNAIGSLDDEARKKIRFGKSLQDEARAVAASGEENSKALKELIDTMVFSSAHVLAQAETDKLSVQKGFVLAAGFAGILTLLTAFMALAGTKYPFGRLLESAHEIARGNENVHIHFTERNDEIGVLARTLASLQSYLKDPSAVLAEKDFNRMTYGTSLAYVPLGSPAEVVDIQGISSSGDTDGNSPAEREAEIAYFGEGTGVDAESQLYQMLALVKHIQNSAASMTQETRQRFDLYHSHFDGLNEIMERLTRELDGLKEKAQTPLSSETSALITRIASSAREFLNSSEQASRYLHESSEAFRGTSEMMERAGAFTSGLLGWAKLMADLTGTVRKAASQAKLLALNASIEAAKSGEKARTYASLASEIRTEAQQSAIAAEQLSANLTDMQNETYAFAEAMEELNRTLQSAASSSDSARAVADEQRRQAGDMEAAADSFSDGMKVILEVYDGFEPALQQIYAAARSAEESLPGLRAEAEAIRRTMDEFVADLPTYEEDAPASEEK